MNETGRLPARERVLVLAPNWLGDVVMSTPLLSWLDAAAGPAGSRAMEIHLAVRRAWAPLFTRDPRLDGLVVVERNGRHRGIPGLLRLAKRIRKGRFDSILLGPPSLRAGLVAKGAGIPRRVGYRGDGRSFLLTEALPLPPRGTVHYSTEILGLGQRFCNNVGPPGIVAPEHMPLPSLPGLDSVPAAGFSPGPPVWALAPGTTYGEAKVWPLERVAEFIRLVAGAGEARVVLLGDSGAASFAEALRSRSRLAWGPLTSIDAQVIDMTGRTDLLEAVGILKSASVFVGNDSGLMHLAAALAVPTVGVFGSSNPEWTAPRGTATAWVAAEGFDCRPCYRQTCNQPLFCLETVTAERVVTVARALMTRDHTRQGGA